MTTITRNGQHLTIHEHWNGTRLVKTPEWQPFATKATQFDDHQHASQTLEAMNGTLDERTNLMKYWLIPVGSIPTDNVVIVEV